MQTASSSRGPETNMDLTNRRIARRIAVGHCGLLLGVDAHLGPCMGAGGGWPPPFVSNAATAALPCAMHPISRRIMVR